MEIKTNRITAYIAILAMLLISFAGVPACAAGFQQSDDGYRYTLDADGNAEIIYYIGEETEVVIPSALDGHPVTTIGDRAFNRSKITSVVIPSSVTTIGESAFFCCEGLTEIEIPDSVTSIGIMAFGKCIGLKRVKLGNWLT